MRAKRVTFITTFSIIKNKERSTLVQILPKIATRCRIGITKKTKSLNFK